jgi:hypothetical protein
MSLLEFLSYIGLPSGVLAFGFALLLRRLDRADKAREKRDQARDRNIVFLIGYAGASLDLSEAIAIALKNGTFNGEVTAARENANEIRRKYEAFLSEQAAHNL